MKRRRERVAWTSTHLPTDGEAGFAVIDALISLTILAVTLSLALVAAEQARKAAGRALELRQARGLISNKLGMAAGGQPGVTDGVAGQLAWRLVIAPPKRIMGPAAICARSIEVVGRRSSKRYSAFTASTCALDDEDAA